MGVPTNEQCGRISECLWEVELAIRGRVSEARVLSGRVDVLSWTRRQQFRHPGRLAFHSPAQRYLLRGLSALQAVSSRTRRIFSLKGDSYFGDLLSMGNAGRVSRC